MTNTALLLVLVCVREARPQDGSSAHNDPDVTRPGYDDAATDSTPTGGALELSAEQRAETLKIHNDLRRLQNSADMEYVTWSDEMAEISKRTASTCKYPPVSLRPDMSTSQNSIVLQGYEPNLINITAAITKWYDVTYNFTNDRCQQSSKCDQHLNLIQASIYKVGCSYKSCDVILGADDNDTESTSTLFVCTYQSRASTTNHSRPPFVVGSACSQCAASAIWCDLVEPRGLCRADCAQDECILNDDTDGRNVATDNEETAAVDNATFEEPVPSAATSSMNNIPGAHTDNDIAAGQATDGRQRTTAANESPSNGSDGTTLDWLNVVAIESEARTTSGPSEKLRSGGLSAVDASKRSVIDVTNSRTQRITGASTEAMTHRVETTAMTTQRTRSANGNIQTTLKSPRSITDLETDGGLKYDTETVSRPGELSEVSWIITALSAGTASVTSPNVTMTTNATTKANTQLPSNFITASPSQTNDSTASPTSRSLQSGTQTTSEVAPSGLFNADALLNATTETSAAYTSLVVGNLSEALPNVTSAMTTTATASPDALIPITTSTDSHFTQPPLGGAVLKPDDTFWMTVILIVSIDSVVLIAIVITAVFIIRRKQSRMNNNGQKHKHVQKPSPENNYFHFELG